MQIEHLDVIVVGAGLSGIGAGYHLQAHCPDKKYTILEGRDASGGTWDLFRYPGIRSDSDMFTLGYSFRPWREAKAIADGPNILNYVRETAKAYGIDQKIRYSHAVKKAAWSSDSARWTLDVTLRQGDREETKQFTCTFLLMCAGYYKYSEGYTPDFTGIERFRGQVIHPQKWPEHLNYAGKRVVVIGSGATAVTLVPELARQAAHVTMLQRSPTYVVSRPSVDAVANRLRRWLPTRLAYRAVRWKNVLYGMYIFKMCRKYPAKVKDRLLGLVRQEMGPNYDIAAHFTPRYNPWEQRLCLVPDSDLFKAIKTEKAAVVTDTIQSFTEDGITLTSGQTLKADIVVSATGLNLEVLGGLEIVVNDQRIDLSNTMTYKGMMYSDIPNMASVFGYTNASWTLKADLTSQYVCRLINHMDKTGARYCLARQLDPLVKTTPWVDFSSGYFQRAAAILPKQGSKHPWKLYQNYALDIVTLRFGSVKDSAMEFVTA
jgi:monooxygenase